MELNRVLR